MVSVAPIYMGFLLFGVVVFAESSHLFADPGKASDTLYSVWNGGQSAWSAQTV